jgi:hypothetical protein
MSRRNTWFTSTLLASGLALAASSAAIAQPGWTGGQYGPAGRGPAAFSDMDTNGDGYVSASEHAAFRAQRMANNAQAGRPMRNAGNAPQFTDIDANGDGRVSQAEMAQFRSQRMTAGRACNRSGRGGGGGGWGGGPRNGGW